MLDSIDMSEASIEIPKPNDLRELSFYAMGDDEVEKIFKDDIVPHLGVLPKTVEINFTQCVFRLVLLVRDKVRTINILKKKGEPPGDVQPSESQSKKRKQVCVDCGALS